MKDFDGRPGPDHSDPARRIGAVVGYAFLAEQCLDDRRAEPLGNLLKLGTRAAGAGPGEDRDLCLTREEPCRLFQQRALQYRGGV